MGSLDELEKRALLEQEKARITYQSQRDAEAAVSDRFQLLVGELREGWQKEESARQQQAENRLRTHYETVLQHAHEQLRMSLQLNDEVDKRLMADVEARNLQQLTAMRSFEAKCRRLYETRLAEYVSRTDEQLRKYEAELMQKGAEASADAIAARAKLRHAKMACHKWRCDYQREIERRYESTVAEL